VNNHIVEAQDRYWLDLHSYYDMDGKLFVIVEYSTDKNLDFAKFLGVRDIFLGWNELYSANPDADRIQAPNDCLILLPSERAEVGTEWFYVGKSLDI
jgi:hypothetical protein